MRLSGKFHVEYTGEADDGHIVPGEFEQEGNDFKAAEAHAQKIVGPNVHLRSVRMWSAQMPREYAVRPLMTEAPAGETTISKEAPSLAASLHASITALDYIRIVPDISEEPIAASEES